MINSFNNIPIIDLSKLNNKDNEIEIILNIKRACKEYGFFYIINHEIINEIDFEKLIEYSKIFFSLPDNVKEKFKMEPNKRDYLGYFGMNKQNTYGTTTHREGIYFDLDKPNDKENESKGIYIYPTDQDEIKYNLIGFKSFILNYIKSVVSLGDIILELISKSLNLPFDYFKSNYTFNQQHSLLFGLIRYPKLNQINNNNNNNNNYNNNEAMALHTDWNIITLLYQDNIGGLQIKHGNDLINATPIKHSFICNIGDIIEIITQSYYISNYHKVLLNNNNVDRFSFPLFIGPQYDVPYKVIDQFKTTTITNRNNRDNNFYNYRGTYKQYFEMNMNNSYNTIYNDNK